MRRRRLLKRRLYDGARRKVLAGRIGKNVDALCRGVTARPSGEEPAVHLAERVPACRVSSQRVLGAFGVLLGLVGERAEVGVLDSQAESFVPDVSHVLRTTFARFREKLDERGRRDVEELLRDEASCRSVLHGFGVVPSLTARREGAGAAAAGGSSGAVAGASVAARVGAAAGQGALGRSGGGGVVRVATWNIAGGHQSSQAPKTWSQRDQRAAVCAEVLRWRAAFQCDVAALQECEDGSAMGELGAEFVLVGSAEAKDTRGHVHLYVRRGVEARCLEAGAGEPCVAASVKVPGREAEVCVVAVHLPSGDKAVARRGVLERVVDRVAPDDGSG